jgi:hypothetical protein
MAVAPEAQRSALADGYVSADELRVAGEAMAACMTAQGSGAPKDWEDVGNGARMPSKVDDRDDACERAHTLWLGWAYRVQITLTGGIWADAVAAVFMNPDAAAEQITAVDDLLHRLFPNATIRFVDKLEARSELTMLFPDAPEIATATPLDDLPTSFRIGGVTDLALLEEVKLQPGVQLIRTIPDALMHPPTGVPSFDTPSVGSPGNCSLIARTGPAITKLGTSNTIEIDLGSRDGLAPGMPVATIDDIAIAIGRVGVVSEKSATLIPLTDQSTRISAQQIQGSVTAMGTVAGNGPTKPLSLTLVDRSTKPQIGDVVSAMWDRSSALPGCLAIGQVSSEDLGAASTAGPVVLVEPFAHLTAGQPVSVVLWQTDPQTGPLATGASSAGDGPGATLAPTATTVPTPT